MYARWYNGGLLIEPEVDEDHDILMGLMNLLKVTRVEDEVIVQRVVILDDLDKIDLDKISDQS